MTIKELFKKIEDYNIIEQLLNHNDDVMALEVKYYDIEGHTTYDFTYQKEDIYSTYREFLNAFNFVYSRAFVERVLNTDLTFDEGQIYVEVIDDLEPCRILFNRTYASTLHIQEM